MLFRPTIASDLSGSIGGITLSHNRGGAYARTRAIPTNPNSPAQAAVRAIVGQLSAAWTNQLDADQREGWETYAQNVPILNRIGAAGVPPALAHYIRCNVPRLYTELARVDDAPTIFNLGEFTPPIPSFSQASQEYSIAFSSGDDWTSELGAAMLVYASRQQGPAINYFTGPYRYLGQILGAEAPGPTNPAVLPTVFPGTAGNKLFLRCNVTRVDGRLSLSTRTFCLAAA